MNIWIWAAEILAICQDAVRHGRLIVKPVLS